MCAGRASGGPGLQKLRYERKTETSNVEANFRIYKSKSVKKKKDRSEEKRRQRNGF